MSLKDCLNSAVAQGEINSREADELNRYYEVRYRQKRAGMNDSQAKAAARDEVAAALRADAKEARRRALLSEARRKDNAGFIEEYRNLKGKPDKLDAVLSLMIHNGYKGTQSMAGKANAIIAMAQRDLAETMHHFRRSRVAGTHMNKVDLPDLVKALHGEPTNNATAKALAGGVRGVIEDLRQRFNEAGGNIPKREDHGLPHSHDRSKIRELGVTGRGRFGGKKIDLKLARDRWKAAITPLLNPEEMTNPHSGLTVGADGLDASLDYVFDSIMSDGWAHRRPEARAAGAGSVASRYQDSRFLIFRDAESWLNYNGKFGQSDPISTIFNHINGISRDIAAMERFGPNPDAAVEWMKQVVQVDIGKRQSGALNLEGVKLPGLSSGKFATYRVDSLWRALRGRETVLDAPAQWMGDIRNVASAAALGATGILASLTDPFVAQSARRLAGLPVTATMHKVIGELAKFATDNVDDAGMARKAVIWDDYLHTMNESARFVDQMFGHEWSRYLVDRALTVNALKPLTEARKRIEANAWHDTLGGFAAKDTDWIDMPPLLKKTMEGFGFSDADWHKMRTAVDDAGFLDPGTVFDKTGDRNLAERYAEMITQWSERSVPAGDPRIKSVINGVTQPGTIAGELLSFATQFMSFGMSFTARQLEAHYVYSMMAKSSSGRVARGAYYFAAMAVPLTIGAGFYTQILNVLNGKDPEDMTTPAFWTKAFVKGGGGGLFADFVDKAENRYGQTFAQTLGGIGGAFIGDSADLTLRTIQEIMGAADVNLLGGTPAEGKDQPRAGRALAKYVGRYTPILSSHPLTRAWYRRMFVDNLQWAVDPEADESFKSQARKGTWWWKPGELTPTRAPDLATAAGP
ncbi:hypothetical protein [Rhizobium tumorigenes]|uniref:hypothetical protein n=1 Tax=Rhizobium tumorigenes TaxID=2041385 RepID=UPI00241F3943|nr:hypothetical protein [Rhizobium tumorigenes]WFS02218.1 hypothetical protein PR016_06285 [Rhizobium tumorigenes]